jgi:hypothetical protein
MHGNPDGDTTHANVAACTHATAPFKSLSLKNLAVEGLAVPTLLQVAVLDVAWAHARESTSHVPPELQEAGLDRHADAWRLTDALQGLTCLDLTGTDFEGFWSSPQSEFIASLPALQDLKMARCNLPSNALTLLSSALVSVKQGERRYQGLTSLDWSGNPVRTEAIHHLCSLTTLRRLLLQDCGIHRQYQMEMRMHATQLVALTRLDLGVSEGELAFAGVAGAA